MDKNAFDIHKNNASSNNLDWIKNLFIVEYGEVETVFDANTVRAKLLVQRDQVPKLYTVRLLGVGSSRLVESTVQPQKHDHVLLLFLRSYDDRIFMDPDVRERNTGDSAVRADANTARYSMFSGVGILASTAKGRAPIATHYGQDAEGAYVNHQSKARIMAAFKDKVSAIFDVPKASAGDTPADRPVRVLFGRHSPLSLEHRAAVAATVRKDTTIGFTLEDGATVTLTSEDGASVTFDKSFTLKADGGVELDAGSDKLSLKNNSGSMKSALDSTLTDCQSLVTALSTFASAAAAADPPIAAAAGALGTALAALGFAADKTSVDGLLK